MATATASRPRSTTRRDERVASLPLHRLGRAQSRALARLTLATAGRTHELLLPVQEWLVAGVRSAARGDGTADPQALARLANSAGTRWADALRGYGRTLEVAREQAASLPFGVLVRQHNGMLAGFFAESAGRRRRGALEEVLTPDDLLPTLMMWQARRDAALQATAVRTHGDGLTLSRRLWRLENEGLTRIRATLASAYDGRTNALALARQLEAELGADAQMPRWTTQRLYGMTPKQRMDDRNGLLTDSTQRARGVAYNAVRLARTELQYANHAVSSEIALHNPAVIGRWVRLSPGHPKSDVCDGWADGGPYPKTDAILPLHPQCMCFYEEKLMERAEFGRQVREWMQGEGAFLDDYAAWLGLRNPVQALPYALPVAEVLEFWLSRSHAAEAVKLLVQ